MSASRGIVAFAVSLLACNPVGRIVPGESSTAGPDAGHLADGGISTVGPAAKVIELCLAPRPETSLAGGPLQGSATIYVMDDDGPVEDAVVRIQGVWGAREARTDTDGCISFEDAELAGTIDVHAFPPENRAYRSHLGLNSAVIVVRVEPTEYGPPQADAVIEGEVLDLLRTTTVTATVGAGAMILPITPWVDRAPPFQRMKVESPHLLANWALVGGPGFDLPRFSVQVKARETRALIALAGPTTFIQPQLQAIIQPTAYGFLTDVNIRAGETLQDREVSITHPANTPIRVRWGQSLPLESLYVVATLWLPGQQGVFPIARRLPPQTSPGEMTIPAPALTGPLAGGAYGFQIIASSPVNLTVAHTMGIGGFETEFEAPDLPAIPRDLRWSDRTITAVVDPSAADTVHISLRAPGLHMWRVTDWAPSNPPVIRFPEVPQDFVDPVKSARSLIISSAAHLPPAFASRLETSPFHWASRSLTIND